MTIRVLLADDQALIRAGFRVLIDSARDRAQLVVITHQAALVRPDGFPSL